MMKYQTLNFEIKESHAVITLNRPEVRNAFNEEMILEITSVCKVIEKNNDLQFIVLQGEGKSFSAGADLNWMKKMIDYSHKENVEDSLLMEKMFSSLNNLPLPLIGRIHGHALGGGCGLAAVCDYVIAEENTSFGFTEVHLGLMPAVISPFVLNKIGESHSRALFSTGLKFKASRALDIGLIHQVTSSEQWDSAWNSLCETLLSSGLEAKRAAKQLVKKIQAAAPKELAQITAEEISKRRVSVEGQEGMKALLEKRKPDWQK